MTSMKRKKKGTTILEITFVYMTDTGSSEEHSREFKSIRFIVVSPFEGTTLPVHFQEGLIDFVCRIANKFYYIHKLLGQ